MVAFGGWDMPIQYSGILLEHEAVRTDAGIFDVSHMGELDVRGPQALAAIQWCTSNDASTLAIGRAQYSLLCHRSGGIVDDCIVYRLGDTHYRIVVNASNIAKDLESIRDAIRSRPDVKDGVDVLDESEAWALLAVQGPRAVARLGSLLGAPLDDVPSFGVRPTTLAGTAVLAARTGYTGEDGFEFFVPSARASAVWDAIRGTGVLPIGLGARDTLRLEARLPLYGQDLDDTTTPDEAGLAWVVKPSKGPFIGRDAILRQRQEGGPMRRLVGFRIVSRGIVRPGAEVLEDDDTVVGRVTSGGPAPTVGGSIGLAYVPTSMARVGESLTLRQRGKLLSATLVSGPFYRRPRTSTPSGTAA